MENNESTRIIETKQIKRILYGNWLDDLKCELKKLVGLERLDNWGIADISANPLRNAAENLAVLYDDEPAQVNAIDDKELNELISNSGRWTLGPRMMRDTIGMREMIEVPEVDPYDLSLSYRLVFPYNICVKTLPHRPTEPIILSETRCWYDEELEEIECNEVYDISDPGYPTYRIMYKDSDMTEKLLGARFEGEDYIWQYSDGRPFIPHQIFHAQNTGSVFDHSRANEIVTGTLVVGSLWSFFVHGVLDASWPQRYITGEVDGAEVDETIGARPRVHMDPAKLLQLKGAEGAPATAGAFPIGIDPSTLVEATTQYERRLASYFGLSSADLQRTNGDPKAGYAMAISREAQRAVQRRYEPQFRKADIELTNKTAALLNRVTGSNHPESGWKITYRSIPRSAEEEKELREKIEFQLKYKLIDEEEAFLMIHPDATEEQLMKVRSRVAGPTPSAIDIKPVPVSNANSDVPPQPV